MLFRRLGGGAGAQRARLPRRHRRGASSRTARTRRPWPSCGRGSASRQRLATSRSASSPRRGTACSTTRAGRHDQQPRAAAARLQQVAGRRLLALHVPARLHHGGQAQRGHPPGGFIGSEGGATSFNLGLEARLHAALGKDFAMREVMHSVALQPRSISHSSGACPVPPLVACIRTRPLARHAATRRTTTTPRPG